MTVRVITPPQPFVTPGDIPGAHAPTDARIAGVIAAVTEEIDGPTGWLGRALAPQLLEWSLSCWPQLDCFRLPCPPEIEIVSIDYVDPAGATQSWAFPTPLYFDDLPAVRGRKGDIRIHYWAGYGHRDESDPTKWVATVPERVRQAIIVTSQHMLSLGAENLFLRSEEVEGVGTFQYTVTDQASNIIRSTADRLLQGLRVYA